MQSAMNAWQPILRGEAADKAIELINTIAQEIPYPWDSPWKWGPELREPDSLAYGNAGVALFFCYLAKAFQNRKHGHTASLFLRDAICAAEEGQMQQGFEAGTSGIFWASQHIKNCITLDGQVHCSFEEWDGRLLEWCQRAGQPAALADGLTGLCVYAAERMPNDSAEILLRAASSHVETISEITSRGTAWHVSGCAEYELCRSFPALTFAGRRYSTSVGYGVAGIVGGLLATYLSGVRRDQTKPVIEGGVTWLLSHKCSADFPQLFALLVGVELPHVSNGWYLGDPGVIAVILNAAIVLGRDDWYSTIVKDACATLPCNSNFSVFNLMSGSIGRAHICNRLFHMTGNDQFADAAREWYLLALESQDHKGLGRGVFGAVRKSQGLFRGTAGLGLGLLAAVSDVEPAWDRAFLASFRKSGA